MESAEVEYDFKKNGQEWRHWDLRFTCDSSQMTPVPLTHSWWPLYPFSCAGENQPNKKEQQYEVIPLTPHTHIESVHNMLLTFEIYPESDHSVSAWLPDQPSPPPLLASMITIAS